MKSARKFLVPLAALVSMVTAPHALASEQNQTKTVESTAFEPTNKPITDAVIVGSHDLFKFVLKRNDAGIMMAYHESHYSHESHSSHVSHHSHYSGY